MCGQATSKGEGVIYLTPAHPQKFYVTPSFVKLLRSHHISCQLVSQFCKSLTIGFIKLVIKILQTPNKVKEGSLIMSEQRKIFILFILALVILGCGHLDLMITNGNNVTLLPYHLGACLVAFLASLLTLRASFRAIIGK